MIAYTTSIQSVLPGCDPFLTDWSKNSEYHGGFRTKLSKLRIKAERKSPETSIICVFNMVHFFFYNSHYHILLISLIFNVEN